jgi:hypothetical protein
MGELRSIHQIKAQYQFAEVFYTHTITDFLEQRSSPKLQILKQTSLFKVCSISTEEETVLNAIGELSQIKTDAEMVFIS